jgi:adenylate cyclase
VRAGIYTGPATERAGDWFGATVNTAARVSALASSDEVLLTDVTREAAGSLEGVDFRERGRRELKNVSEPVVIYAAQTLAGRSAENLPIDPVCRMAVDPQRAAGRLTHEGVEYHFCSLRCAQAFAAAPDRYTHG